MTGTIRKKPKPLSLFLFVTALVLLLGLAGAVHAGGDGGGGGDFSKSKRKAPAYLPSFTSYKACTENLAIHKESMANLAEMIEELDDAVLSATSADEKSSPKRQRKDLRRQYRLAAEYKKKIEAACQGLSPLGAD